MNKKPLYIQIDPHHICNFSCSYCSRKHIKGEDPYPSMFKNNSINSWIKFFGSLQRDIVVMLSGLGEPSLDKNVVEFVKQLDKLTNCIGIVVFTNASKPNLLREYLSCQKVFIHASFHRDHFEIDVFLDNLKEFAQYGRVAKVSYVVTKESTKEQVSHVANKVAKLGIQWFHVIADRHDWITNQSHHLDILSNFHTSNNLDYNIARRKTRGIPCMVGRDYIWINSNGDVWPCQSYRSAGLYSLGNVFNGFEPRELPLLCMFNKCNGCVPEYTQIVGSGLSYNLWGVKEYKPFIPDRFLRYMTFPLLFAKPHLLFRHLKSKLINHRKN